ncbi:MAG: hypothetical protein ACR2IF_16550 [Terriglobales bacterium]
MHVRRSITIATITLLVSSFAWAQYLGGGGMPGVGGATTGGMGTVGTTSTPRYGPNKAAIGAAAGAGAGAAVLYVVKFRHPKITGCIGPDGNTIVQDNGKSHHLIGSPMKPGERVKITAKKMKDSSGEKGLDVLQVQDDLGRCEKQASAARPITAQK